MAAALTALLLLGYASVQATLMQTVMARAVSPAAPSPGVDGAPSADMAAMPGMAMAGMAMATSTEAPAQASRPKPAPTKSSPTKSSPAKPCPFCSAAAHAPIPGHASPLRLPTAAVFTVFLSAVARGPRGPPERQPRARGPPSLSL